MASEHVPVLLREAVDYLDLHPGLTVVDGTIGGGGHSRQILEQIGPTGLLIGLDRDPLMLRLAASNLSAANCRLHHASYAELSDVLNASAIRHVDRILLDLGLSSDQLSDADRGFSFASDGPLDLRFDVSQGEPAWQFLERVGEAELVRIFEDYGEERFSRSIARGVLARRKSAPVRTAADLAEVVAQAVPAKLQQSARKEPATRVFQALRIAVNQELLHLERALEGPLYESLASGGRLVLISFHSLEDRLVKTAFRSERWQNLTKKPVTAGQAEQRMNPRSRTAKLRAAIKI